MFEFDASLLDDPEFKEDSVREEVIVPILRRLGYSASGPHTSHPEWSNKIVEQRPVIVVPRGAIRDIRRPGLGGQLVLETEQERFSVGLKFFGKKKALSWLREDLAWLIP